MMGNMEQGFKNTAKSDSHPVATFLTSLVQNQYFTVENHSHHDYVIQFIH